MTNDTKPIYEAFLEMVALQKEVLRAATKLDRSDIEEMLHDCHNLMTNGLVRPSGDVDKYMTDVREWADSMLNNSPDTTAQEEYDSAKSAEAYAINNKMRDTK